MALRLQTVKPANIGTVLEKYKVLSFDIKMCLPRILTQNAWINAAMFKQILKC